MDSKIQPIPNHLKEVVNNRPIRNEWSCECGGKVYASPTAQFARCTKGDIHCTVCRRKAKKFGKRGLTCGTGCVPHDEV